MIREHSAGVIVFRREKDKEKSKVKYLLILGGNNHWGFPKGLIEKGEKSEDAAVREVFEETAIKDLVFIKGFKEKIKFFFKLKGKLVFKTATFFLAETKTNEVKLSYEHKDFDWVTLKEAMEKLEFKNYKELLKKTKKYISQQTLV